MQGVYYVRRKLRGSISYPEEKRGISLLYHGCYRSNLGISNSYTMVVRDYC